MRTDDLILVSVDDHIVEPPDMFERHVPGRWKEQAPRSVRSGQRRLRVRRIVWPVGPWKLSTERGRRPERPGRPARGRRPPSDRLIGRDRG